MEHEVNARFERIEADLKTTAADAASHERQIEALFKTTEATGQGVKELHKNQVIMAD